MVKGQWQLFGGHTAFATVQHLHKAAQWQSANPKFGVLTWVLLARAPFVNGFAKANGEYQHGHPKCHGHAVVPILMHSNEHSQRE